MPKLYLCKNPSCSLGSIQHHGRFTGGITAQQKHMLTGHPLDDLKKGVDYGEGICPNCGQAGEAFSPSKAAEAAAAEAKARYDAEIAAIKEGVS